MTPAQLAHTADLLAELLTFRQPADAVTSAFFRNRRKLEAAVKNAQATLALREEGTHLGEFVWSYQPEHTPVPRTMAEVATTSPESVALSKELRRRGFRFVGPTTMYALMQAVGIVDDHLVDSHRRGSSGVWTQ